jgi:hypothetical protein
VEVYRRHVFLLSAFVGLLALLIATRVPPRRGDHGGAGTATAEALSPGGGSGWSLATA